MRRPRASRSASHSRRTASIEPPPPSAFHLSILTDEISQDFGHACEVASRDFGMGLVDLREAGGKNLMNWDAAQVADVLKVLDFTGGSAVERELALIKVSAEDDARAEVLRVVDIFRAKIVGQLRKR